jgi:spore germination cell wall hydrolase CwlJ-like protein
LKRKASGVIAMSATAALIAVSLLGEPGITVEDHECLAMNIYHEARGEDVEGQIAVAHVTMNRVEHEYFPDTVCDVVYQARYNSAGNPIRHQCQFSWYCDGRSDRIRNEDAWQQAREIAFQVMTGEIKDNTDGATFYHTKYVSPHWIDHMEVSTSIGVHIFYVWDGRWI